MKEKAAAFVVRLLCSYRLIGRARVRAQIYGAAQVSINTAADQEEVGQREPLSVLVHRPTYVHNTPYLVHINWKALLL